MAAVSGHPCNCVASPARHASGRIEIGHELDGALPGFAIDNLAFETNGQAPGATSRMVPFPPVGVAVAAGVLAMLGWRLGGAARAGRHAR